MKKLFVTCLTLAMVLCMSTAVFAAPNGFVSSPSGNAAPGVVGFAPANTECTADPVITPYSDKDKLPSDQRAQLEKAYDDITGADDLTDLSDGLKELAAGKNVKSSNLAVSHLFNISSEGCDDHADHKKFTLVLGANAMKNFVGLLQMDENGNWGVVQGATINAEGNLEFTLTNLAGQLAVVVDAGAEDVSPQTGDSNAMYVYGALMAVSALAIVILVIKNKKHA